MKIKIEAYEQEFIYVCKHDGLTINEMMNAFTGLLKSMDYHEDAIANACAEYAFENCKNSVKIDFDEEGV